jgi:RNA polymerase sigma-70 factor (ECF subfamily)
MRELQDDIVLAFKQGDKTAFDAIYHHFYQPILSFCKYMVTVEEAEDILAETFFKLWKLHQSWESINNIKAFLYMTARNACFDLIKSKKTREEKQKEIALVMEREQELILQSEMESELIFRVKQEIESLPGKCKEVFTLSYFEGYKNPEIAEKLSISDQTVKNLKAAALKAIRTALLKKDFQVSTMFFILHLVRQLGE